MSVGFDINLKIKDRMNTQLNRSYILKDLSSSDLYTAQVFDPTTGEMSKVNLRKLKSDYGDILKNLEIISTYFDYRPQSDKLFIEDEGTSKIYFNTYVKPVWKNNLQDVVELPEHYDLLLDHLTDGYTSSKNYILDWMAFSLHAEHFIPFLVFIGSKGVGKGLLGECLYLLHGMHNVTIVSQKMFTGDFNSQLENKTIAHLDEIKIETDAQENKLKMMITAYLDMTGKFVATETKRNWAKVFITANGLDALRVTKDERRFSIPYLTKNNLSDATFLKRFNGDIDIFYQACKHPENIALLGNYLMHRYKSIDRRNMGVPFFSEIFEKACDVNLKEWEQYIKDRMVASIRKLVEVSPEREYFQITYIAIQDDIKTKFPKYSKPPGRTLLEKFIEKFGKHMSSYQDQSGTRNIRVFKTLID